MKKLAVFDMDGTIFESYLDWPRIKNELGITTGNILKELYRDNKVDTARLQKLEDFEESNTLKTKPIKGIYECLHYLGSENIKTALVTNNNKRNTDYLLNKFQLNFDLVITREMKLWKPEPDAFLYVMKKYGCGADETITIGDSHYDIKASAAAQINDIFIIKKAGAVPPSNNGVIYFDDFIQLKKIFKEKFN